MDTVSFKIKKARKIIKIAKNAAGRMKLKIYLPCINKMIKQVDSGKYLSAKATSTVKWLLYLKMTEILKETHKLRENITEREEQATIGLLLPGILSTLSEVIHNATTYSLTKRRIVTANGILFTASLREEFRESLTEKCKTLLRQTNS